MNKWIIPIIVFSLLIPIVYAPYWFGTEEGLVLHITCDGDFTDRSGEGNDGTQSGGVSIGSGIKGRACEFDGNYVNVGNDSSLNFIGNITVSMWVKIPVPLNGANGVVIAKDHATDGRSWTFLFNQAGNLRLFAGDGIGADASTGIISDNEWTHVAWIYESNISVKYYINGLASGSDTSVTPMNLSGSEVWIGARSYSGSSLYFNGSIDEVRVYNVSLTASEIYDLYNMSKSYHIRLKSTPQAGIANETPVPTMVNETPTPTINDESGLVGYWQMDDLTNGNTTDESGEKNNASIIGATFTSSSRWNSGYKFDGINDYAITPSSSVFDPTNNFSVSFWIYTDSFPTCCSRVIAFRGSLNTWRFAIHSSNKMRFFGNGFGADIYGTSTILNKWAHAVGVYNGTDMIMYVNGVQEGNTSITGLTSEAKTVDFGFEVGGIYYFNGTLDEVKFYNRSLSTSEVKELYLSKGLVGHWSFDSADGSDANFAIDKSGYQNNGTVTNDAVFTGGRFEEGYKFDGGSTYITAPDAISLQIVENLTINVWSKPDTLLASKYFIVKRGSGITQEYGVYPSSTTDEVAFQTRNGTDTLTTVSSGLGHIVDVWQMITVTYNGTNVVFYRNSVEKDNNAFTGTGIASDGSVDIGGLNGGTTFNGTLDEVKIFNRILTPSEIKELYVSKGLVGHWTFDSKDGSNSTISPDVSGYNNDGTVTGATFTNQGRFKEGYYFPGTTDKIAAPHSTSLDVGAAGTQLAFGGWFKFESGNVIISKHGSPNANIISCSISGGKLLCDTRNVTGLNPSTKSATSVNDGKWHHFIMNIDRIANESRMYIDGVLDNTTSHTQGGSWTNDGAVSFAINNDNAWHSVSTLDEFKIFNRGLTAAEVAALYNGTKSFHIRLKSTPRLGISNETPAPEGSDDGLVGHWKFNTNADDSSGEGNDGTLSGDIVNASGRWDDSYEFDGIDDYISTPSISFTNFTISTWIKTNTVSDPTQYIGGRNTNIFMRLYGNCGNYAIDYGVKNSTGGWANYLCSNNILQADTWYNYVFTFNTTNMTIYVNGAQDVTRSFTGVPGGSAGVFAIGSIPWSLGFTNYSWNGSIDEVRIYNRSLSASEAKELYLSKGLIGHWTFDTKDGSDSLIAPDISGYNHSGTITGATFTNEGKFKEGYDFVGSGSSYINLTSSLSNFASLSAGTISAWVKTDQVAGVDYQAIVSVSDSSDASSEFVMWIDLSNNAGVLSREGGVTVGISATSDVMLIGEWYHLVSVSDGTNPPIIYVNGVDKTDSSSGSGFYVNITELDFMAIGTNKDSGASVQWQFNGIIDEVKIFNRALSATEVAGLYNGTKSNRIRLFSLVG